MDDFHLAPKALLKAKIKKKNKKLGWETRFIALGMTQLLISRDEEFTKLLNVIPLAPGTFAIKMKKELLTIKTSEREFIIKFNTIHEAHTWFCHILQLTGRELTDFISETSKIKQHRDVSKQMKTFLNYEQQMKEVLINLSKVNKLKERLEK